MAGPRSMIMIRNSERQTFKKCRHRWQWTYLAELQGIEAATALRFGDLVHQALAIYYKPGQRRGPHPVGEFERLYHEQAIALGDEGFDVFTDDKWAPALDLGRGMLEGYVDRYKQEDKGWIILSSEQTFQIRLRGYDMFTGKPFWFKIVGTFDGVWKNRETGRIIFKEHKTAKAVKLQGLAMDEQAGTYWTYGPRYLRELGILKENELPSYIEYTFLRKAVPDDDRPKNDAGNYLNKDGSVSKNQPAPFFVREPVYRDQADREIQHARVLAEAAEIKAAREGKLSLHKNPGPLHMPNCVGCAVKDACEVHEAGGDWQAMLDMEMKYWDPYAAHELAERF